MKKITLLFVLIITLSVSFLNAGYIDFNLSTTTLTANIMSVYYVEKLMLEAYIFIMHVVSLMFYSNAVGIIFLIMVFKYFTESLKETMKGNMHIWVTWLYQSPTNNIIVRFFILMILLLTLFRPVITNQVVMKVKLNANSEITSIQYKDVPSDNKLDVLGLVGKMGIQNDSLNGLEAINNPTDTIVPLIAIAPVMLYQNVVYGIPQGVALPNKTDMNKASLLNIKIIQKLLVQNMIGSRETIEQFLYILKSPAEILTISKQLEGLPVEVMSYALRYEEIMKRLRVLTEEDETQKKDIIQKHIDNYLKLINSYSVPMSTEDDNKVVEFTLKHLAVSLNLGDEDILNTDSPDIREDIKNSAGKTFFDYFGNDNFTRLNSNTAFYPADKLKPESMYNMFVRAATAPEAGKEYQEIAELDTSYQEASYDGWGKSVFNAIGSAWTGNQTINTETAKNIKKSLLSRYNITIKDGAFNNFELKDLLGADQYEKTGLDKWKLLSDEYAEKIFNAIISQTSLSSQPFMIGTGASVAIDIKSASHSKYPILVNKKGLEGILLDNRLKRTPFKEDIQFENARHGKDLEVIKKFVKSKLENFILKAVLERYFTNMQNILSSTDYTVLSNVVGLEPDGDHDFEPDDNILPSLVTASIIQDMKTHKSELSIFAEDKTVKHLENLMNPIVRHSKISNLPNKRKVKKYTGSYGVVPTKLETRSDNNEDMYGKLNILAVNDNNSLYSTFLIRALQFSFDTSDYKSIIIDKWSGAGSNLLELQTKYSAKLFNKGLQDEYNLEIISDFPGAEKPVLQAWVTAQASETILNKVREEYKSSIEEVTAQIDSVLAGATDKINLKELFIKLEGHKPERDMFFTNWVLNDKYLAPLLDIESQLQIDIGKTMGNNYELFGNILYNYNSRNNMLEMYKKANPGNDTKVYLEVQDFIETIKKSFSRGAKVAPRIFGITEMLTDVIEYATILIAFNSDNVYEEATLVSNVAVEGISEIEDELTDTAISGKGDNEDVGFNFGEILDWFTRFINNVLFNFAYLVGFATFGIFMIGVSVVYGFWLITEYIKWGFASIYKLIMTASSAEPDWKGLIDTFWDNFVKLLRAQTGPLFLALSALVTFILGEGIRNLFFMIFLGPLSAGVLVNVLFFAYVILTAVITLYLFKTILQNFQKVTGIDKNAAAAAVFSAGAHLPKAISDTVKTVGNPVGAYKEVKKDAQDKAYKDAIKDGKTKKEAKEIASKVGFSTGVKDKIVEGAVYADKKLTGGTVAALNENVVSPLVSATSSVAGYSHNVAKANFETYEAGTDYVNDKVDYVKDKAQHYLVDKPNEVKDNVVQGLKNLETKSEYRIDDGKNLLQEGAEAIDKGILEPTANHLKRTKDDVKDMALMKAKKEYDKLLEKDQTNPLVMAGMSAIEAIYPNIREPLDIDTKQTDNVIDTENSTDRDSSSTGNDDSSEDTENSTDRDSVSTGNDDSSEDTENSTDRDSSSTGNDITDFIEALKDFSDNIEIEVEPGALDDMFEKAITVLNDTKNSDNKSGKSDMYKELFKVAEANGVVGKNLDKLIKMFNKDFGLPSKTNSEIGRVDTKKAEKNLLKIIENMMGQGVPESMIPKMLQSIKIDARVSDNVDKKGRSVHTALYTELIDKKLKDLGVTIDPSKDFKEVTDQIKKIKEGKKDDK